MSKALHLPQYSSPVLPPDRLKLILQTQSALVSVGFDLDNFMKITAERMQELTKATGATIELVDGEEMVYAATSGSVASFAGLRIRRDKSLSGLCVRKREVMISEDTSADPRVDAATCKKVGAASMIVVPLFRLGQVVGVLKVVSTRVHAFTAYDIETLHLLADLLGGALGQQIEFRNREQGEETLRRQAQYDSLTGLPNRMLFRDRLDQAINRHNRSGRMFALFYMDLDHFKAVNDTHGHDAGDTLLRLFAARISPLIRKTDTFARLGGDEFTMILEEVSGVVETSRIGELLISAAGQEFDLGTKKVNIGLSIGCALAFNTRDPEELMKNADTALYKVKKTGRNGFKIFNSDE